MAATMKTAISPFGQAETKPDANSLHFLDEDMALVQASSIPEEFRKLSRFLPVIVLFPKSAVSDRPTQRKPGPHGPAAGLPDVRDVCNLEAAKAWIRNPSDTDTFEFGKVTGRFSTMEIHCDGRPVILTCKEFRMLAYLIKNPGR